MMSLFNSSRNFKEPYIYLIYSDDFPLENLRKKATDFKIRLTFLLMNDFNLHISFFDAF